MERAFVSGRYRGCRPICLAASWGQSIHDVSNSLRCLAPALYAYFLAVTVTIVMGPIRILVSTGDPVWGLMLHDAPLSASLIVPYSIGEDCSGLAYFRRMTTPNGSDSHRQSKGGTPYSSAGGWFSQLASPYDRTSSHVRQGQVRCLSVPVRFHHLKLYAMRLIRV